MKEMSTPEPYKAYRKTQIQTASREDLLIMLYDAAIKNAKLAKARIEKGDIEGSHNAASKAESIVSELMASLDMESGELARNLFSLYEYINHRLVSFNISKESETLDEVIGMLAQLRQSWNEALFGKGGD